MANMTTPMALSVSAFNATESHTFYFNVSGGNQVVRNTLVIRRQYDNMEVYNATYESYDFSHTIPANTLQNGVYYNYYFITYDIYGNYSAPSNIVGFWCYTTPQLVLADLGSRITSSSLTVQATYFQAENELVNYCLIELYDSNKVLIKQSNPLYTVNNIFTYTFEGFLNDNSTYYVKAKCITINNTNVESQEIQLQTSYEQPTTFRAIELTKKCQDGYIQLDSNFIPIEGETSPTPPEYTNNTEIYMANANRWVMWQKGYSIPNTFGMLIKMKMARPHHICRFDTANGNHMSFIYSRRYIDTANTIVKDCIYVICYDKNWQELARVRSNYVDIINNTADVYISLNVNNGIMSNPVVRVYNQVANYIEEKHSNIVFNRVTDLQYFIGNNVEKYQSYFADNINPVCNLDFPLTNTVLANGVFDFIYISRNFNGDNVLTFPEWDFDTILACDFKNNVSGGNTILNASNTKAIKIKRRKTTDFDWTTVYYKDIHTNEDFNIHWRDSLVPSGIEFEWVISTVMNNDVETLETSVKATPLWRNIFITVNDKVYKLYSEVSISTTLNQPSGSVLPIGAKVPYIIKNGNARYFTGKISAKVYGYNFETTRQFDSFEANKETNDLLNDLATSNCIGITDWSGNIFIAKVLDNPTVNYSKGVPSISFDFVEQGDYNNQTDLYNCGFVDRLE